MIKTIEKLLSKGLNLRGNVDLESSYSDLAFCDYKRVLGDDFSSLVNSKFGFKITVKAKERRETSKINNILDGLAPAPFEIKMFTEYKDDMFMRPYDLGKLLSVDKALVNKRLSTETKIGGQSKFPQNLAITMLAAFEKHGIEYVKSNIYLRMLKFYVDTFKGLDPFRERDDGGISNIQYDAMASVRCLILLRAFHLHADGKYPHGQYNFLKGNKIQKKVFICVSDMDLVSDIPIINAASFITDPGYVSGKGNAYSDWIDEVKTRAFALKDLICIIVVKPFDGIEKLADFSFKVRKFEFEIEKSESAFLKCALKTSFLYADIKQEKVCDGNVLFEVVKYVFENPWVNQTDFKGMSTMCKQSFMDNAAIGTGEVLEWDNYDMTLAHPVPTAFRKTHVKFNDSMHYKFASKNIFEELQALMKHGLFEVCNFYTYMINCSPNEVNLSLASIGYQLVSIAGFMRTERAKSHKKQTEVPEKDFKFKECPYSKFIHEQWKQLIKNFYNKRDTVMSEAEFFRRIPSLLTSKSAGEGRIEVSLKLKERVPGAVISGGSWVLPFQFRDKTTAFLHNAGRYLDKKFQLRNSEANPFNVGTRDVPGGKASRAIFVMPLFGYLVEGYYIPSFQDDIMQIQDKFTDPLDGNHTFTLGKESGKVLVDHFRGIHASSHAEILLCETDFSTFDTYQKFGSTRKFQLSGMWEGYRELNLNENMPFLGYKNPMEAFEAMSIARSDLYFSSYPGAELLRLDQLFSGEFQTLLFNDISNRAYARHVFGELVNNHPKIFEAFKLSKWTFQGDDAIGEWYCNIKNLTYEKYIELGEVMVKCAREDNLSLNSFKTVRRFAFYEYLKKTAIYGKILPLYMQTDILTAESPSSDQFPLSIVKSMASTCMVMVSRGWDHELMLYWIKIYWMLKRAVRMVSLDKTSTSWFVLPHCALYVPVSMKGGGMLPKMLLCPSKDGLIGMMRYEDSIFGEYVNAAAKVIDVKPPRVREDIAKGLLFGRYTTPTNFFTTGAEFVKKHVMLKQKVVDCLKSVKFLEEAGVKPPRQQYTNFTEELVITTLAQSSKLKAIDDEIKITLGNSFERASLSAINTNNDAFDGKYGWLKTVKVIFGSEIDRECDGCPFGALDRKLSNLYEILGYNRSPNAFQLHPEQLFSFIRKDKNFPRNIRPEQIFDMIAQPNIIFFPERIFHVLVTIGLDPRIAAEAVQTLMSSDETFRMLSEGSIVSMNDPITGQLNLSRSIYARVVKSVMIDDKILTTVLNVLSFVRALYHYFETGVFNEITLRMNDEARAKMFGTMTGRPRKYDVFRYLGVYDSKPFVSSDD